MRVISLPLYICDRYIHTCIFIFSSTLRGCLQCAEQRQVQDVWDEGRTRMRRQGSGARCLCGGVFFQRGKEAGAIRRCGGVRCLWPGQPKKKEYIIIKTYS